MLNLSVINNVNAAPSMQPSKTNQSYNIKKQHVKEIYSLKKSM